MTTRKKNTKSTARKPSPETSPEVDEAQMKRQLYVNMAAAVRAWLAVKHPQSSCTCSDRIDICRYDDLGGGETLACFHASADSPYVIGDLMAMPDK